MTAPIHPKLVPILSASFPEAFFRDNSPYNPTSDNWLLVEYHSINEIYSNPTTVRKSFSTHGKKILIRGDTLQEQLISAYKQCVGLIRSYHYIDEYVYLQNNWNKQEIDDIRKNNEPITKSALANLNCDNTSSTHPLLIVFARLFPISSIYVSALNERDFNKEPRYLVDIVTKLPIFPPLRRTGKGFENYSYEDLFNKTITKVAIDMRHVQDYLYYGDIQGFLTHYPHLLRDVELVKETIIKEQEEKLYESSTISLFNSMLRV